MADSQGVTEDGSNESTGGVGPPRIPVYTYLSGLVGLSGLSSHAQLSMSHLRSYYNSFGEHSLYFGKALCRRLSCIIRCNLST